MEDKQIYTEEWKDFMKMAKQLHEEGVINEKMFRDAKEVMKTWYEIMPGEMPAHLQETYFANGYAAFINTWNVLGYEDDEEPTTEKGFADILVVLLEEHIKFLRKMGVDVNSTLN